MAPQDPSGTGPSAGPDNATSDTDTSVDAPSEAPEGDAPEDDAPGTDVRDDAGETADASSTAVDPAPGAPSSPSAPSAGEPGRDHGALTGSSVDYAAAWSLGTGETPAVAPSVAAVPSTSAPSPPAANPAPAEAPEAASDLGGWFPSAKSTSHPTANSAPAGDRPATETAEARSARRQREAGPETASSLTADRLLEVTKRPPVDGWRRLLHTLTFGYVNVGDSDAVRIRRALEHRIAARLGERTRFVPVLSRKGGVGKTTVTTLLGMTLADMREDRIIAMDANPDRGTLSDRSPGKADFTARQLVQNRFMVDSFAQLSSYVAREGSRLHVLASDTDPAVAQAFDDSDYRAVTDILSRYYSIVLTDSGTGMVHSVMKGTLEKADAVVLVSGGSVDEARLASETLSWLEAHGRHDLVANAIVVINLSSGNGTQVNVAEIEEHFRSRVSTVVRIPYDRHLAEGSRVDLARLKPATRDAVIELAALVVDELQ
ncbi:MinD/ParA family ATP-binding protein [Arthrobacter sp. CAN_A1]|uniref:MinD/ParA family ATP-binding protein n=1 Tax=Arthrobacter sp. CAN_A1 TaxID=2787717 RepID=UPI0018C9F6AD